MVALAGPLAEQRYRPITPEQRRALWRGSWRDDLESARHHVEACSADGQWVGRQVRELIRRHWPAIMLVATALQERGTLTVAEVDTLMRE